MSPNTRSDTNSGPQNRTPIEDGGSSCRDRGREHRALDFADTGQVIQKSIQKILC